ncbi:MAG: tetratricopeptide repeat protein [Acidobacteriota bacterium]
MDEKRKQEEQPSASGNSTQAVPSPTGTTTGATFNTHVSGGNIGTIANIAHADTVIFQQAASSFSATSLHQLPSPPVDFTGRQDEIDELLGKMERGVEQGGVTISGLRGMGGIGKTALALVLSRTLKTKYPDAQFYLDLKGAAEQQPLSPMQIMQHVISSFHPEMKLPDDMDRLSGLYHSVLDGKRALLVMDNARDDKQVRPLLPPDGCVMIVTSRQHFNLPGLFVKDLDTLSVDDACGLLLKIAPRIGGQADEMARLCWYLPLALRLAADLLAKRTNFTIEEYLRRLAKEQERLKLVDASISLSYQLLSEELQEHWRMLAVFPDTFDLKAAMAVWAMEEDGALDRLSELMDYSLVLFDQVGGRYRLHDLVRLFADAKLGDDERYEAQGRHSEYYCGVLREAKELYKKGNDNVLAGLKLFDTERVNIEAGQKWAAGNAEKDERAAGLCCDYPDAGVYVLSLRLHPRERIDWMEAALTAAKKLGRRDAEGVHLGNLGTAYADLGKYRNAIEYYQQALIVSREIGDRRGEGQDLGSLGIAYRNLGEYRKAIEYCQQALFISREIGDRRAEGGILGSLGNAYYSLGEYRKAIEYYEQCLTIAREIGDRRGEGNALTSMGNAYADLGDTHKAISYYEQALVIHREIGDRMGEGIVLGNLGIRYKELGDLQKAIDYYQQALAIKREIGDVSEQGYTLHNLADEVHTLGQRSQAIACAEESLTILEQIESPRTEEARTFLARLRSQQ